MKLTIQSGADHTEVDLSHLIEQGFGHYSLKLGTRGLESLRPKVASLTCACQITARKLRTTGAKWRI
jgi:hypothetical protein